MSIRFFLEFESIGYIEPNIFLCSIYMDFVILLSVFPFSDTLNVLKEISLSVMFVLFVLDRFTSVRSGVSKLTTSLESTVPQRISTISMSQKLGAIFPTVLLQIPKKPRLISDIINLLVPKVHKENASTF